jgi:hypothetical protein
MPNLGDLRRSVKSDRQPGAAGFSDRKALHYPSDRVPR